MHPQQSVMEPAAKKMRMQQGPQMPATQQVFSFFCVNLRIRIKFLSLSFLK